MTVLRSPLISPLRSPLRSPLTRLKGGGGFEPGRDLFAPGDILLDYDPADLTTMFQDTAGTTPVTADGQSVSLRLDKGQWNGRTLPQELAVQSELVTNSALPAISSRDGAGVNSLVGDLGTVVAGDFYMLVYTVDQDATFAGNTFELRVGASQLITGGLSATPSPGGTTYTRIIQAAATGTINTFHSSDSQSVLVVSFSCKRIPGYPRIQATGPSMPKYKTDGTLHWLLYDGSDDGDVTPAINWGTDEVAVSPGLTKSSDTTGMFLEFSASSTSNNSTFYLLTSAGYAFRSKGTLTANPSVASGYSAPVTNVLTGLGKISTDTALLRVDGAQVASDATNQGTGNFGNYPLYFGRRGGASLPFSGREYRAVLRNRLWSASEQAKIEAFIAAKSGL